VVAAIQQFDQRLKNGFLFYVRRFAGWDCMPILFHDSASAYPTRTKKRTGIAKNTADATARQLNHCIDATKSDSFDICELPHGMMRKASVEKI